MKGSWALIWGLLAPLWQIHSYKKTDLRNRYLPFYRCSCLCKHLLRFISSSKTMVSKKTDCCYSSARNKWYPWPLGWNKKKLENKAKTLTWNFINGARLWHTLLSLCECSLWSFGSFSGEINGYSFHSVETLWILSTVSAIWVCFMIAMILKPFWKEREQSIFLMCT